ncbi:hypothetical protein [Roseibacillus ishigakijimensis]|uniref:Uncharacterized protein n=1 Tax=Roseibacillus ishigakijimensis TaxID=454146 RepID=A0A934RRB9_9BACT|nr:hypothetical protein [Roseibacillus ishigakijimensis]MBK1834492.1 hypothetical protein [Roseibacillus ishigakijimensis]
MKEAMHPYESLSLSTVGIVVGIYLVASHGLMLAKSGPAQAWLKKLPRHYNAGVYTMSLGLIWFWLLVAPDIRGSFSWLGTLSMDLGEFNFLKRYLQIIVPLACFGLITQVREFLFVRGLGVVALMVAAPILEAAFLKEPSSRILLSFFAYALLTKGMFWIGMPYTFRDAVDWATKSETRWKALVGGGLAYGVLILILSVTAWRGH